MTGYRSILEAYRSREMEAKTRGTVQSGYHPQEQQCSCLQSNSKSDAHENILLSDLLPDEKLHAMQRGSYFVDGRLIWWFISTAVICGGQGEEQETEGAQEENRSNFKVAKKSESWSRMLLLLVTFVPLLCWCGRNFCRARRSPEETDEEEGEPKTEETKSEPWWRDSGSTMDAFPSSDLSLHKAGGQSASVSDYDFIMIVAHTKPQATSATTRDSASSRSLTSIASSNAERGLVEGLEVTSRVTDKNEPKFVVHTSSALTDRKGKREHIIDEEGKEEIEEEA